MFVGVGSISAQTETSILYKKHTFELGPEISYIPYKELGMLKGKSTMCGLVYSGLHSHMFKIIQERGSKR